jgi:hypothetical protein
MSQAAVPTASDATNSNVMVFALPDEEYEAGLKLCRHGWDRFIWTARDTAQHLHDENAVTVIEALAALPDPFQSDSAVVDTKTLEAICNRRGANLIDIGEGECRKAIVAALEASELAIMAETLTQLRKG